MDKSRTMHFLLVLSLFSVIFLSSCSLFGQASRYKTTINLFDCSAGQAGNTRCLGGVTALQTCQQSGSRYLWTSTPCPSSQVCISATSDGGTTYTGSCQNGCVYNYTDQNNDKRALAVSEGLNACESLINSSSKNLVICEDSNILKINCADLGGACQNNKCICSGVECPRTLSVFSTPNNALVYITGPTSDQGMTTRITNLAAGDYDVKIVTPGYEEYTTSLSVGDQPINLNVNLTPATGTGTLHLTSTPSGASISIDGTVVAGSTPVDLSRPAGSHIIALTKTGSLPYVTIVNINNGGTTPVDAVLTVLDSGNYGIYYSTPFGVDVYFDDVYKGITPFGMQAPAGAHRVRAIKHGYKDKLYYNNAQSGSVGTAGQSIVSTALAIGIPTTLLTSGKGGLYVSAATPLTTDVCDAASTCIMVGMAGGAGFMELNPGTYLIYHLEAAGYQWLPLSFIITAGWTTSLPQLILTPNP
ncbi:MAG TPA: PEGA domain-containing protein [Candidatus Nanoarchaeia archaeon]|nr:PEGA domain-containing protein [Candidatus Nanoarchaeia archaeon]